MEAGTTRSLRQPSAVDLWLREVVPLTGGVPQGAEELLETAAAPVALRRIIKMAKNIGQSCSAWQRSGEQFWLFVGELSHSLSRERGGAVLVVDQYRKDGEMVSTSMWLQADGTWVRLRPE